MCIYFDELKFSIDLFIYFSHICVSYSIIPMYLSLIKICQSSIKDKHDLNKITSCFSSTK